MHYSTQRTAKILWAVGDFEMRIAKSIEVFVWTRTARASLNPELFKLFSGNHSPLLL